MRAESVLRKSRLSKPHLVFEASAKIEQLVRQLPAVDNCLGLLQLRLFHGFDPSRELQAQLLLALLHAL